MISEEYFNPVKFKFITFITTYTSTDGSSENASGWYLSLFKIRR